MAISDSRRTATLRDWWFVQCGNRTAICGKIYHDRRERFKDGQRITTSSILRVDFQNKIVVTKRSTYILGEKRVQEAFKDTEPGGM